MSTYTVQTTYASYVLGRVARLALAFLVGVACRLRVPVALSGKCHVLETIHHRYMQSRCKTGLGSVLAATLQERRLSDFSAITYNHMTWMAESSLRTANQGGASPCRQTSEREWIEARCAVDGASGAPHGLGMYKVCR